MTSNVQDDAERPTITNGENRQSSRERFWSPTTEILPGVFTIVAWCGIGFGILILPTGLFVGPQILFVSLGIALIGIASAFTAAGLRRQKRWAMQSAMVIALAIEMVGIKAILDCVRTRAVGNGVFFVILVGLIGSVMLMLLLSRKAYK